MKKKPISIKSRKAKGRELQNWTAEKISKILDMPWGREDGSLIEPRQMGQKGVDVVLRGEALKQFPFSIEAKNCEKWAIHDFIEQAQKNEKENTSWLLVCKRNRSKPVVILDAEEFFDIYRLYLLFKN